MNTYIHTQAVVAGADWTLTHRKLSYATLCLTNIPGCELVATNRDRLVPAADGMKYPGALSPHWSLLTLQLGLF